MPLQLYQFGVFSPYSPFVNILTTPFVVITSLGGIASAIVALIWPLGGVWVTGLLKYPTLLFLEIVDFSSELPGSSIAVGKASVIQLLVIYGLMVLVWLRPWFSKRWWTAAPVMISLIFIPSWYYQANLAQITIVADGKIPTLIFQDRGQVSLVNSGGQDAATYTIVPFLHQQGVNQIDWVLSTDNLTANRQGWLRVLQDFPIQVFYDASDSTEQAPTEERWSQEAIQNALADRQGTYQSVTWGQALSIGSVRLTALTQDFHCWLCQWQDASWLWLWDQNQEAQTQLATVLSLPDPVFLWWSGELLAPALLKKLSLQGAIASDQEIDFQTLQRLKTQHIPTYWTGRDGALQWSPGQEIQPTLDLVDSGF
jgi:competence protein ComEC